MGLSVSWVSVHTVVLGASPPAPIAVAGGVGGGSRNTNRSVDFLNNWLRYTNAAYGVICPWCGVRENALTRTERCKKICESLRK